MAGHGISRRWRARLVVVSVLALAGAGATAAGASAQQPGAHAASRTATLIIRPASVGKYEVIVWVRTRSKHSRVVHVYLSGQRVQTIRAEPWWGARVYYTLKLTGSLTVRTVNPAPAVQVRASLILKGAAVQTKTTTNNTTTTTTTTTTTPTPTPAPAPTPPPPPPPANPPYSTTFTKLIWDEEFTGAAGSAADSNWVYDTGPSCGDPGCSVATTSTANAALDGNGNLAITALRSGSGYTAAQLETQTSVTFHVGEELDARIKLPAGQGLWGGFWFYQSTGANGSPCAPANCGELDVLEAPEFGPSPTTDFFDLHGPLGGSNQQQWEAAEQSLGDLSGGFHIFGVSWAPGLITWTIDGTPFAAAAPSSLNPGSTWEFDQGNYRMLLDLAVGGWPGPATAATPFPSTMLVDWVRVFASS